MRDFESNLLDSSSEHDRHVLSLADAVAVPGTRSLWCCSSQHLWTLLHISFSGLILSSVSYSAAMASWFLWAAAPRRRLPVRRSRLAGLVEVYPSVSRHQSLSMSRFWQYSSRSISIRSTCTALEAFLPRGSDVGTLFRYSYDSSSEPPLITVQSESNFTDSGDWLSSRCSFADDKFLYVSRVCLGGTIEAILFCSRHSHASICRQAHRYRPTTISPANRPVRQAPLGRAGWCAVHRVRERFCIGPPDAARL